MRERTALLSIDCEVCGRHIAKPWRHAQRCCSRSCAAIARNKARVDTKYRQLVSFGHPLACPKTGSILAHRKVLFDSLGPEPQNCHWCKKTIYWTTRDEDRPRADQCLSDHLDGDTHNNDLSNLVPACHYCNARRACNPRFLTHCVNGHELSTHLYVYASGLRVCRACQKDNKKRTNAKLSREKWLRRLVDSIEATTFDGGEMSGPDGFELARGRFIEAISKMQAHHETLLRAAAKRKETSR